MNEQATNQAEKAENGRGLSKIREGVVVSNKMDKTVVVAISQQILHPQYKKYIRRTRKCYAHDEVNQCGIGDRVRIVETRPLSKKKRWRVQEVVEKAVQV